MCPDVPWLIFIRLLRVSVLGIAPMGRNPQSHQKSQNGLLTMARAIQPTPQGQDCPCFLGHLSSMCWDRFVKYLVGLDTGCPRCPTPADG